MFCAFVPAMSITNVISWRKNFHLNRSRQIASALLVQQVLVAALGQPVEKVFAEFDPVPLAAASIGHAHGAVLWDGTEGETRSRYAAAFPENCECR